MSRELIFVHNFPNKNIGNFYSDGSYSLIGQGDKTERQWKIVDGKLLWRDVQYMRWLPWSNGEEGIEIIRLINDIVDNQILGADDE